MSDASADRLLSDLLAVIHRDGGHHSEEVGLEQSVTDAIAKIAALRLNIHELERTFEILQEKEIALKSWI